MCRYGDYIRNDRYIFPFKEVPQNSNIVIYGAGSVGQTYYDQLGRTGYCSVVAWVDKNYKRYQEIGITNVEDVRIINEIDFDYIVISIVSFQYIEKIKNGLLAQGIPERKIIYNKE